MYVPFLFVNPFVDELNLQAWFTDVVNDKFTECNLGVESSVYFPLPLDRSAGQIKIIDTWNRQ